MLLCREIWTGASTFTLLLVDLMAPEYPATTLEDPSLLAMVTAPPVDWMVFSLAIVVSAPPKVMPRAPAVLVRPLVYKNIHNY